MTDPHTLRRRTVLGGAAALGAGLPLLDTLRVAQQRLGQGQTFNGRSGEGGVVAASSPMDTGFGFGYFPNLHIGATSWFVMASLNANPYRFL